MAQSASTQLFNPLNIDLKDNKLTFALGVSGYKGAAGKSDDVNVDHSGVIITNGAKNEGGTLGLEVHW